MPVGVPYAPAQRIRQRSLERAMVATAQEKLVSLAACCIYLEQPADGVVRECEKINAIRPLRRDAQRRRIAPDAGIFFRDIALIQAGLRPQPLPPRNTNPHHCEQTRLKYRRLCILQIRR